MNDQGHIYFLQRGNKKGPIKVGFSRQVRKRIKTIKNHHPDRVFLLAQARATRAYEAQVHGSFRYCRIKGEWYRPDIHILGLIDNIKKRWGPFNIPILLSGDEQFYKEHGISFLKWEALPDVEEHFQFIRSSMEGFCAGFERIMETIRTQKEQGGEG